MNMQQTIGKVVAPLMQQLLDNQHRYALKKCQIIRAEAEIECLNELGEKPEKITKKHKMIKRYEKHLLKMEGSTYWTDCVLGGIAQLLVEHFKAFDYKILGPFGLSCETPIWVFANEEDQRNSNIDNLLCSITFVPCHVYEPIEEGGKLKDITLFVKDYSRNTKQFPENSIEDLNGGNTPNLDITDWTLEKLIEYSTKNKDNG